MGSRGNLLRTLMTVSGGRTAAGGVISLVPNWRTGWDSNPRWACTHGGFQDRCLKPLGHPSVGGVWHGGNRGTTRRMFRLGVVGPYAGGMATAGYSGKALSEKLGVRPGDTVLALNAPAHYADLLAPLPEGATIASAASEPAIVHAFFADRAQLAAIAEELPRKPRAGGMLWVSWPKKSSPLFVDLTEDGIRAALLPTGWVDVKVCAVDADWSGLKFLKRRA